MPSSRHILLLLLGSRPADASPLVARYANTTWSRPPVAYTSSLSTTITRAYLHPAHADGGSSPTTCTTSAETDSNLPSRESPSAYGLGVLTAPAPTTPPPATTTSFTLVAQQSTSEAAPHFSYAPAQSSRGIEVAATSTYSTGRYSNVSTMTRSSSTMVTLYTTIQPKGYGALQTGSGGDVTVTSLTTIYPGLASSTASRKSPEQTASSISTAGSYASVPVAYSSSSASEASTTSSMNAPYYSSSSGEHSPTTSSGEHSTTRLETSTTLLAYQPPSEETASSSGLGTNPSPEATTASTSQPEQSSYTDPLPASSRSSTSMILGGITIVPVNPYSMSSMSESGATVTVTVTDAGVTTTVTATATATGGRETLCYY